MVSGQILDPEKSPLPYPEKTRPMYSSEDLERFYVEYQSEWVPRGMTMLAVLSQDELLEFERMLETSPEEKDRIIAEQET